MIHYPTQSSKVQVANGTPVIVKLKHERQPIEDITIWVEAYAVGNYSIVPTLNDVELTAKAVNNIVTKLPTSIILDGIFPPESNLRGVQVGVKITNNGSDDLNARVTIIGRSYGAAS